MDASWGGLAPGRWASVLDKAASSTFIAVTDQRIITATPRALLQHGEIADSLSVDDVRYIRTTVKKDGSTRTTIDVTTSGKDLRWILPAAANDEDADSFAAIFSAALPGTDRDAIEDRSGTTGDSEAQQPEPTGER